MNKIQSTFISKFAILLIVFGITTNLAFGAALSGTYTINPKGSGSKNYLSFAGATTDLANYGVSGPVTFNVYDTTYLYDYIYVNYGITGTSSTNTVTFQSVSGDSSKTTIKGYYSSSLINFSNTRWVTFKGIGFDGPYSSYMVYLTGCSHFTFSHCKFTGNKITASNYLTAAYNGLLYANGSYYSANNAPDTSITVKNCYFKYGTRGCDHSGLNGYNGKHSVHDTFSNNIFDSIWTYNLTVYGDSLSEISNNIILGNPANLGYSYYGNVGIYLSSCADMIVSKNRISLSGGGTGIWSYCFVQSSTHPVIFKNNFIEVGGPNTAPSYGFFTSNYNCQYYYNSVFCHAKNINSSAGYFNTEQFPIMQNNIFAADSGFAITLLSMSAIATCDHNDLYSKFGYLGNWGGAFYRTLAAWQTVTNLDSNSIAKDPKFYSFTNLHIKNAALSGKAVPITGITDDIDGKTRGKISCTIGADEITGGIAKFGAKSYCVGDSTEFIDSSIYYGVDTIKHWQWTFGDGDSSLLQNPRHLYRAGGNYTIWLKITTALGGIDSTSRSTYVDTTCQHLLKGMVSTSTGAALRSTKIYMCTYTANDSIVHLIDSTNTDTGGYYSFKTTLDTVYLFAFPTLSAYPHELPTWADTGVYFPEASSIGLHLGTNFKNFHTIYGANPGGGGLIGGKVNYCNMCKNYGSGNPTAGVRVLLADSNGKVQTYTYINANGYFSFANILPAKYKIFVDQPLVKNNPAPIVTIDVNNPFATGLNFTLYPTYLSLNVVNGIQAEKTNAGLNIYPNPANNKINIEIANPANGTATIADLSGRVLLTKNINLPNTSLDISSLPKGLYILKYQDKDNVTNKTIIKQ